jgi:hypothetical protein
MASINQALSPPALPIENQRYADLATICHGQIVGDCLRGDLSSDKEVLVLGDSHAAMLNHFFDQLGTDLGFKARIITASSCVTIPGFDFQRLPEWAQNPCQSQIKHAQEHLSTAKVIFLAGKWSWQLESTDFQVALQAFLSEQSQLGVRIYVMEQIPMLRKNPQRAHRFQSIGLTGSRIDFAPTYNQANAELQSIASSQPSIATLNFEASRFFKHAPFADGNLIYMDEHHLNEIGSKRYANVARIAVSKSID